MLYSENQLKEWTGIKTRELLLAWLRENGIAFFVAKGRICATQSAIDKAQNGERARSTIEFA